MQIGISGVGLVLALGLLSAVQAATPAGGGARQLRDPYAGRHKVLIIGDLHTGNQIAHDAVSHALARLEQLGRRDGDYVAFIRTDTDLVTKSEVWGMGDYAKGGSRQAPGRNLDYFDAVVLYTNGETEMTAAQKEDLRRFVAEDGKGLVAVHTAAASMYGWPEFGNMIGGYFDDHPWNVFDAPVRVERPDSSIVQHLPPEMIMRDEMYQYRAPYAREDVDVLLSLEPSRLDLASSRVHRRDADFPIAWTKRYGKGRVFSSSLGHTDEAWDDPRVQTMYLEAIKWVLGVTDDEVQPHAAPPPVGPAYVPASVAQGSGPYKAVMVVEPSLPTHTVYRPQTLPEAAEGALPIVAWANGACVNYGNRFRYFLTEIASHGYLAVAIGPPGSPALESTPALPPVIGQSADPAERTPPTHAVQLIDAIDWAIAQNSEPGSPYFRRLDTSKIAVMGQSCGGLQAIVAAADPRVTTTMIWNSGTFEGRDGLPGAPATRASLAGFHGPVAYISGDESDVAFKNSEADFELIDQVPVFRAWKNGVGHSGTYREAAGGAFAPVAIAWLDWHLKGRLQQAAMFVGRECALCTMPQWQVKTRGFEVFEGLRVGPLIMAGRCRWIPVMLGSGSGGLLREAVSHAGRVAALLCMLQATTVWPAGIAYSAEMPQAAAGGADTPGPAADDDLELVVRACAVCHPIELVISQPRTDDEWDELILRMVDHGAVANDDEQWRILEYFLRHYARDND